jgi:hypothetical protein
MRFEYSIQPRIPDRRIEHLGRTAVKTSCSFAGNESARG